MLVPYEVVINKLFALTAKARLGSQDVYVRVLSDIDLEARDRIGIAALRKERKALSDPASSEYQTKLGWLDELSKAELVEALVAIEQSIQAQNVAREILPVHVPMPPDATPEEKAETIEAREKETTDTGEARRKLFLERIAAYQKEVEALPQETILSRMREKQIPYLATSARSKEEADMTIVLACFGDADCTAPLFPGIGEVRKLNRTVKDALEKIINELDSVDVWSLKD